MRERTVKQQAVYHLLLRADKPMKRTEVVRNVAVSNYPDLPGTLPDYLPWTEGSARDVLEALVRRGEARRITGRPARYIALPAPELNQTLERPKDDA